MPYRRNGSSEREKLGAQHQKWHRRKTTICKEQLSDYDQLQNEKTVVHSRIKESLVTQKAIDVQLEQLRMPLAGEGRSIGDEETMKKL
jgi:hypothetical protein